MMSKLNIQLLVMVIIIRFFISIHCQDVTTFIRKQPLQTFRQNPFNFFQPKAEDESVSALCDAPPPYRCDYTNQYRTHDGSCNNFREPTWGQTNRPFNRLLSPQLDSNDALRSTARSGGELPSARMITTKIMSLATPSDLSSKFTNILWLWGQFIDHDMTFTPVTAAGDCCSPSNQHPDCAAIKIPADDPLWQDQKTCMDFKRSKAVKRGQCNQRAREQINELTAFLDGGMVYGSSDQKSHELRSMTGGKMKMSANEHLPHDTTHSEECPVPVDQVNTACFKAGDVRSTEWIGLTSMHTIFIREHNRIAEQLYNDFRTSIRGAYMSESQLDEKIYQESRKIVIALIQAITYKEFLPLVLGQQMMYYSGLNLGYHSYHSYTNPTILSAFSSAAFRFGHSLISMEVQPKDKSYSPSQQPVTIDKTFFAPDEYYTAKQDNIIRGLCTEASQLMDDKFSSSVRDKLFEQNFGEGFDLPALNIQRGRDHGLPTYNRWRQYCRLSPVTSFSYMPDHPSDVAFKMSQVYEHPDDIDLYVGAVTERPVAADAVVGPTMACIIKEQFKRLKEGDRYWFESRGTYPFSLRSWQIQQITQTSLAKIICQNSNSPYIPQSVFHMNSNTVKCDSLDGLDLKAWASTIY